jgi:hypothetical protein
VIQWVSSDFMTRRRHASRLESNKFIVPSQAVAAHDIVLLTSAFEARALVDGDEAEKRHG